TSVRGNYLHLRMPINKEFPYWSQISTIIPGRGVIAEHNVIRDGEWIVRMVEGEFRYNLVMDIIDHDLAQSGSTGKIHHNMLLVGDSDSRQGSMSGCIAIVYPPKKPGDGMEVYNNLFDGGAKLDIPAIEICNGGLVKTLRNNVFYNFGYREKYFKRPQSMIRHAWNEVVTAQQAARLGYANFNLFFRPKVKTPRNYLLGVSDKTERRDVGFGLNDIPK